MHNFLRSLLVNPTVRKIGLPVFRNPGFTDVTIEEADNETEIVGDATDEVDETEVVEDATDTADELDEPTDTIADDTESEDPTDNIADETEETSPQRQNRSDRNSQRAPFPI